MRIRLAGIVLMLSVSVFVSGQGQGERGTAGTTVGGKRVSLDYGRPALKGRKFADLMKQLPADRMWRAGSGAVTILSAEGDLLVGGKKVPAGKYSVYVHCPETGDYSLVLNSDLGQPLGKIWAAAPASQASEPYPHFEYTKEIADKEVARVVLKRASTAPMDQLSYLFKTAGNGATLTLAWGDQSWSVDLLPAR